MPKRSVQLGRHYFILILVSVFLSDNSKQANLPKPWKQNTERSPARCYVLCPLAPMSPLEQLGIKELNEETPGGEIQA